MKTRSLPTILPWTNSYLGTDDFIEIQNVSRNTWEHLWGVWFLVIRAASRFSWWHQGTALLIDHSRRQPVKMIHTHLVIGMRCSISTATLLDSPYPLQFATFNKCGLNLHQNVRRSQDWDTSLESNVGSPGSYCKNSIGLIEWCDAIKNRMCEGQALGRLGGSVQSVVGM